MAPTIPHSRRVKTNGRPAARAMERPCESGARIGVRDREDLDRRVHDPNGVSDGPGLFALLSGLIPDA